MHDRRLEIEVARELSRAVFGRDADFPLIMTSDKGARLKEFVLAAEGKKGVKGAGAAEVVVFVDDKMSNLVSVAEAFGEDPERTSCEHLALAMYTGHAAGAGMR